MKVWICSPMKQRKLISREQEFNIPHIKTKDRVRHNSKAFFWRIIKTLLAHRQNHPTLHKILKRLQIDITAWMGWLICIRTSYTPHITVHRESLLSLVLLSTLWLRQKVAISMIWHPWTFLCLKSSTLKKSKLMTIQAGKQLLEEWDPKRNRVWMWQNRIIIWANCLEEQMAFRKRPSSTKN